MNTSHANLKSVPITIIKKKMRMNLLPLAMANRAPRNPPKVLQAAMGNAASQIIFPFIIKSVIEPKLVARFTILAWADACKKSKPSKAMKARIKKLPVPGPIKPS